MLKEADNNSLFFLLYSFLISPVITGSVCIIPQLHCCIPLPFPLLFIPHFPYNFVITGLYNSPLAFNNFTVPDSLTEISQQFHCSHSPPNGRQPFSSSPQQWAETHGLLSLFLPLEDKPPPSPTFGLGDQNQRNPWLKGVLIFSFFSLQPGKSSSPSLKKPTLPPPSMLTLWPKHRRNPNSFPHKDFPSASLPRGRSFFSSQNRRWNLSPLWPDFCFFFLPPDVLISSPISGHYTSLPC